MIVVGIVNAKGGVGKTTLTLTLSVRAAVDSPRVALVDLDSQGSTELWHALRGDPDNPAICKGARTPTEALEGLAQTGWDWVFFDGCPNGMDNIEELISVCDVALVPIRAGLFDLKASHAVIEMLQAAKVPYLMVVNDVGPTDKGMVDAARRVFERDNIPVAVQQIAHRKAHSEAMAKGKTGPEISKRDDPATVEIEALWQELLTLVKTKKTRRSRKAREVA